MDLTRRLTETLAATHTLERELGGGGMSRVFLANEISLDRRVVIKVLPPDMSSVALAERFRREISLAARLRHPNIVPLLTAGDVSGLLYYTMPFVEGLSLRELLASGAALSLNDSIRFLRGIADALAYAHRNNVVHRDIKPENVLIESGIAVVTDFGVSKALANAAEPGTSPGTALSTVGVALGTIAYMSPEQAVADPAVDHRADLYSLGVVAYEIFTGRTPFPGLTAHALVRALMVEEPEPLAVRRPDLPPALAALVMRLLSKNPSERPATADEVVVTLDGIAVSGGAEGDGRPFTSTGAWAAGFFRGAPRSRIRIIGATVLLILLTAIGFQYFGQRSNVAAVSTDPAGAATEARSVAVLPFDNTDGAGENQHFSDGLTDELIGALGKLTRLKVAARTSVFALKGKGLGVQEIGDTLDVATVLEGSVRRSGDRLRVTARLVRVSDGSAIWSEVYDRRMTEVFAVQEEIANAIVTALDMKLSESESRDLAGAPTRDLEAYDLYLKALFNWNQRTREKMETALAYLERAVERDPQFALAYAGMASTYLNMSNYGHMSPAQAFGKAAAAADRAIALDPSLAEAQTSRGFLLASTGRYSDAEKALRKAIERNPNLTAARHFYSLLLVMLGQPRRALEQNAHALSLDPLFPTAVNFNGIIRYVMGDASTARRQLQHAISLSPNHPLALHFLGVTEMTEGRYREAVPLLERAYLEAPGFPGIAPALAVTLAKLGRQRESNEIVARMRAAAKDNRSRVNLALGEAIMGDLDAAFSGLSQAQWDVPTLVELRTDPLLAGMRADPRYPGLLAKAGLRP